MDPEVAQLVREQRLLEAGQLASDRGDSVGASRIYEQACAWARAAVEALRAGDASRALRLAIYGGDGEVAERALAALVRDGVAASGAAAQLTRAGHPAWAARILEECGRPGDAARLWASAGEVRKAAAAYVHAGEPAEAARVLHEALAADPRRVDLALDLGGLLARLGRWEAVVRLLQRIPATAPERSAALAVLVPAFERAGLPRASDEARAELATLARGAPEAPPAAPDLERASPPPNVFGRYVLAREVASSPHARLLECRDPVFAERIAVKIFAPSERPDALARFTADAVAIRALHHPAIVAVRDWLPEGPAAVSAWMPGGSLEDLSASFGRLEPTRAAEIAGAMLSALAAAHRLGVLHRDLKPTNVLFDEAGGAKIADFGTAHFSDVAATATTRVLRSLAYVSPEQREGRPASERSDVYSVGVMLHEMLTGEAPSPYRPPRSAPSQRAELGAPHDALVARLTAPAAGDRPASALAALALLERVAWPRATRAAPGLRGERATSTAAAVTERLSARQDAASVDEWMGRPIERVPIADGALLRARAFAAADDAALQAVWRVDEESAEVWLERLDGPPLGRVLSDEERAALRRGLGALHRAGGVHGRIDRKHVAMEPRGPVLRLAIGASPAATPEEDLAAVDRL